MIANAVPLLAIFEKKLRLEVPLFQRQYVWSRDQQWQPLWEDISRKFTEYLEGKRMPPSTSSGPWCSIRSRPRRPTSRNGR